MLPLAAALILSPFAAADTQTGTDAPYVVPRSVVTNVIAPDGHAYRVFVSWPDGPPPPQGWPVLYVLDGADNFVPITETARRLGRAGARSAIGDGIVVGIDSGPLARRVSDYTPASPGWTIPRGMPASGLATGGAEAFLDVFERQIQPLVAARWRVNPTRQTLAGHSFGGLLALHVLFTRPALATRYAAISPSLWFGGDLMAREERRAILGGRTALIAIGDEGGPNDGAGAAAEALAARMTGAGLPTRFVHLAGQTHGTTMLAATGALLALAFGEAR